jgi:catechol 2,3-dioxygenase-like lactoylglutathione lyase family enzyme
MDASRSFPDPFGHRRTGAGWLHEANAPRSRPDQVDPAAAICVSPPGLLAAEDLGKQSEAVLKVGHGMGHVHESRWRLPQKHWEALWWRGLPVAVRCVSELDDDAGPVLWMDEGFLPVGIGDIDVHWPIAGPFRRRQSGVDVCDIEGQVVRARAIVVQEAAQEVVALDVVRGEDFESCPGPEPKLGWRKAGRKAAGEPLAAEVSDVAGKGLSMALDRNRDVIEVHGVSGHSMMLVETSLRSQAVHVIGFDHVVLAVADVERSVSWYTEVLGLAAERVDEWRRKEVPFPSVRVNAATIIDLVPRGGDAAGRNLDHFCLVVEPTDLAAWADATGLNIVDGPDRRFGAQGIATSIYVQDPDDNTIELRHY